MSTVARRARLADPSAGTQPISAERVLQAFNTWAFKRQQPTEPQLLLATVGAAVARLQPLQFVLYWGKGPRASIAAPECECLDYLAQMSARIETVYAPGADFTLIFTDTHATLNGHGAASMASYYGAVAEAAGERGFARRCLSDIVAAAPEAVRSSDAAPNPAILAKLQACAAKWYRGEGSTSLGAARYYRMNMVERRAIEFAFPGNIFLTFNSAEYRELFPAKLPVFYMYSMRKGVAVKPWFVEVCAGDTRNEAARSSSDARALQP